MIVTKHFNKLNDLFTTFEHDFDSFVTNIYVSNTTTYDSKTKNRMFCIDIERSDNSVTTYCYRYNSTDNISSIINTIDAYFNKYVADNDKIQYQFEQINIIKFMLVR